MPEKIRRVVTAMVSMADIPRAPRFVPRGYRTFWRIALLYALNDGYDKQRARQAARYATGTWIYETGHSRPSWGRFNWRLPKVAGSSAE